MTNLKYLIVNGESTIAYLWESEEGQQVLVPVNGTSIDFNFDIEARNVDDHTSKYLDLRQLMLDLINGKFE